MVNPDWSRGELAPDAHFLSEPSAMIRVRSAQIRDQGLKSPFTNASTGTFDPFSDAVSAAIFPS